MSMSVHVFGCPWSSLRNYTSDLHKFFSVLLRWHSDMLRLSDFMDDIIHVFAHKLRLPDVAVRLRLTRTQPWAWRVGIPIASSGHSGLLLAVTLGMLNIYDIMFAHNVLAYITTRKWRVLKELHSWQCQGWNLRWWHCSKAKTYKVDATCHWWCQLL